MIRTRVFKILVVLCLMVTPLCCMKRSPRIHNMKRTTQQEFDNAKIIEQMIQEERNRIALMNLLDAFHRIRERREGDNYNDNMDDQDDLDSDEEDSIKTRRRIQIRRKSEG